MELVLVPRADHELAVEPAFAEWSADVIADIGDDAELAVLERHGHQPLAELRLAQGVALEVLRGADVDPLTRLVHEHSLANLKLAAIISPTLPTAMTELERSTMARVTWRLLPFLLLLYIISWLDRVNVGLRQAADERGPGLERYRLRLWRRHLLSRLRRLRDTEQPPAGAVRCAALDRAHHDHLGPDLRRHDVRAGRAQLLRDAPGCSAPPRRASCPASSTTSASGFRARSAPSAVSWFMIGIPLSIVFGGPLSGWLLGFEGHLGLHGWQWMFLVGRVARRDPRLRRARFPHRQARRREVARRRSSASGSAQTIEAEHTAAQARHGVSVDRGAAASHGVAARRHHVLLPDRQLWPHALGSHHREGSVGFHEFRSGVDLGACRISPRQPAWS